MNKFAKELKNCCGNGCKNCILIDKYFLNIEKRIQDNKKELRKSKSK